MDIEEAEQLVVDANRSVLLSKQYLSSLDKPYRIQYSEKHNEYVQKLKEAKLQLLLLGGKP